jgi:hypothetical protein
MFLLSSVYHFSEPMPMRRQYTPGK